MGEYDWIQYRFLGGYQFVSTGVCKLYTPQGKDFLLLGDREPVPFLQIPDKPQPLVTEARELGIRFTYDQAPHIYAAPFCPYPEIRKVRITRASTVIEARDNGWKVEVCFSAPLPEVEGLKSSYGGQNGFL